MLYATATAWDLEKYLNHRGHLCTAAESLCLLVARYKSSIELVGQAFHQDVFRLLQSSQCGLIRLF